MSDDGVMVHPPDGTPYRFVKVGEVCAGLVMTKIGEHYQWERAPSDFNPVSLLVPAYIAEALQIAAITLGTIGMRGLNRNTREGARLAAEIVEKAMKQAGIK